MLNNSFNKLFRFVFVFSFLFVVIFSSTSKVDAFNYSNFLFQYTNGIQTNLNGLNGLFGKVNFGNFFAPKKNVSQQKQNEVTEANSNNDLIYSQPQKSESKVADTPVQENVTTKKVTTLGSFLELLENKTTNSLMTQSSATPSPAQMERYDQQTGKQYIAPNSQNYAQPLTANSPEVSADNYYKQNPSLVGAETNNPSVWNGDPATRPTDNPSGNAVNMNSPNFTGSPDANADSLRSLSDGRFTEISPDGWLTTKATNFGLNVNGGQDTGLVSYASGCPTSMSSFSASGPVKVCNTYTCVVSLPPDVMDYYWGKTNWGAGRINRWTTPGPLPFANPTIGSLYRKIAGTPIEIVNKDNNKCTVAPLWETGPSKSECQRGKCGLDLTYCVKVTLLQSRKGLTPVKYRPVPQGKRGCEGYDYVPSPVNNPVNRNNQR